MKKFQFKSFLPFPERRLLSYSLLGLTLGSGALLAVMSATNMHEYNVSQLDLLQNNLSKLQDSVNKPALAVNLNPMTQQIQQLSQQLDDVRAQNSNHLDQALNQTETALITRLDEIQQMVRHLNEKQLPVKYLPPESLPFSVVSVDSIQHVSVATLDFDFKYVPLEKGDSLAGWRVISIDYGTQRIEFENAKKEHVLMTLENIETGEL